MAMSRSPESRCATDRPPDCWRWYTRHTSSSSSHCDDASTSYGFASSNVPTRTRLHADGAVEAQTSNAGSMCGRPSPTFLRCFTPPPILILLPNNGAPCALPASSPPHPSPTKLTCQQSIYNITKVKGQSQKGGSLRGSQAIRRGDRSFERPLRLRDVEFDRGALPAAALHACPSINHLRTRAYE